MSNTPLMKLGDDQPRHIAVVMDGNGRWALQRGQPRLAGHHAGVKALRHCVEACLKHEIEYLTVFAFSSENWRRPVEEVSGIMTLFVRAVQTELADLHRNGVSLRFIGDRSVLPEDVLTAMRMAEELHVPERKLTLVIAMNYGGRWDIVQAAKKVVDAGMPLTEQTLAEELMGANCCPEPDLIIRTGGELRISNFLLWQAAYAELYFTERLWPDFSEADLLDALFNYAQRERRFGALPLEQVG